MSYGLRKYQQWSDSKWRKGCFQVWKGHHSPHALHERKKAMVGIREKLWVMFVKEPHLLYLSVCLLCFLLHSVEVRRPFAGAHFCLPLCGFRGWNLACVLICWAISPAWYFHSYSLESVLRQGLMYPRLALNTVEDRFEHLILFPLSPKCFDYSLVLLYLLCACYKGTSVELHIQPHM